MINFVVVLVLLWLFDIPPFDIMDDWINIILNISIVAYSVTILKLDLYKENHAHTVNKRSGPEHEKRIRRQTKRNKS